MKNCLISLLIFIVIVSLSGCCTTPRKATAEKSQLEMREYQTRNYETKDTKMVLKAMLNVLQDDGYMVKNADAELGFLTATKEVDVSNAGEAVIMSVLFGAQARWSKNSIFECTANVSEYGETTRVRATFQVKVLDNVGGVVSVKQVEDEKHYQDFFAKVDKGIFIEKEGI